MADDKEESLSSHGAMSDGRGFAPDQMVECEKCRRKSAPTRMNCLYCGAPLPVSEQTAQLRRPTLRQPEEWEAGFNVVLLPASGDRGALQLSEVAALVRLEVRQLEEMLKADGTLPLARVAAAEEAALIEKRLRGFGLTVEVLPDEVLALETHPALRIRRLEFSDDVLTGWSGDEAHVLEWPQISLLVGGRLFVKQIEMEERSSRLGLSKELADAREMTEDEGVLDLFGGAEERGVNWRMTSAGFDYSCLGEHKQLLARDNFVTLAETLRERCTAARYDDAYLRLRHLLSSVWPLAERTEARGLRRTRPGKFNVEAATVVSNEGQWTRYARLRFYDLTRRHA